MHFLGSLEGGPPIDSLQCLPIIQASVRVLGVWLAEESLALSTETCELLPFLLKLCSSSGSKAMAKTETRTDGETSTSASAPSTLQVKDNPEFSATAATSLQICNQSAPSICTVPGGSSGNEVDLLKFLLPGLSSLTAEETSRKILMQAKLTSLLLHYLEASLALYLRSRCVCVSRNWVTSLHDGSNSAVALNN